MGAFLSGLMGALKGVGGGLGKTVTRADGLLGGLDTALAGTPVGAATAPGSGGTVPASDLGDFRLVSTRGGLMSMPAEVAKPYEAAPIEAAPRKRGFLERVSEVDPTTGYNKIDAIGEFGARLQDLDDGGDRASAVAARATGRLATAKNKALAAQIDALFPDDPQMRFLMKANPDKAAAAIADVYKSRNEAYTLGEGQRRGAGGQTIDYAPEVGVTDGYGYTTTADGQVRFGDQRGRSWSETEAERHNRETEELGQGNLGVARQNAATSGGHLGVARQRLDFDRAKDARGAGEGGFGGGGGLQGMSTADLIAALRGAR